MLPSFLEIGRIMSHTTPSVSLYATTLHLVKTCPKRVCKRKQMAEVIGKSPAWVSDFANGKNVNVIVHDVQRLHDFLIGLNF